MPSKVGFGFFVLLTLGLLQSALSAPLLVSTDRVALRLEKNFYEHIRQNPGGSIPYPTGNKDLDELMREFAVDSLLPTFSHDAYSLADAAFQRLGMEYDYRFITKRKAPLDAFTLCETLSRLSIVKYAEPIYRSDCDYQPNDWAVGGMNSWGIDSCHARQAWDTQQGDSTVLVATIDTGVNYNHPDLWPNIKTNSAEDINHDGRFTSADSDGIDEDNNGYIDDVIGWNFTSHSYTEINGGNAATGEQYGSRNNNPMDVHGHGTHVCGSIAARTNNGIGVAAASFNVRTICVRAGFAWLNSASQLEGSGYDDDFEAAIQYAVNRGVRIISISFGGAGGSSTYQAAIAYAHDHNCLMFAAAGNDNDSIPSYPAAYDSVVSVAALGIGNVRASFSNFGNWVDIAAPGVNIWSTMSNNVYHNTDYAAWSGTSMATPTAASCAALMLSRRPTMSADTLDSLIRRTAKKHQCAESVLYRTYRQRVN